MIQKNPIKSKLKKGDTVVVIAGKDKGKQGKISEMLLKDHRVVVEGVNVITRHTKPTQKNPQGGKVTKEGPIHISNVMLLDPKSGKPTRLGMKITKTSKVRFAKNSKTELNA